MHGIAHGTVEPWLTLWIFADRCPTTAYAGPVAPFGNVRGFDGGWRKSEGGSTMKARAVVVAGLVAFWLSTTLDVGIVAAQMSPMEVYQKYLDAYRRGDVAGIVALFSDDAVFVGGGGCRPTPCVGQAAIRAAYQNQFTGHYQLTLLDAQVDGETIRWRASVQNEATHAAGVARIITTGTTEVRDGKIVALRGLPDPSDPETATFVAWQARQAAPMPTQLPRAGDAELRPVDVPLVLPAVGVVLVVMGSAQFMRRPAA
ncbi:MAG TPA: nuclear transport factor 2 family protein [Chloroflexota bacterium]|nr:nuclear transport factor 2 family protein [Chloroflexota bacterium]